MMRTSQTPPGGAADALTNKHERDLSEGSMLRTNKLHVAKSSFPTSLRTFCLVSEVRLDPVRGSSQA